MVGIKTPQSRAIAIQQITWFRQISRNNSLEYPGILYKGRTTSKHFDKMNKNSKERIDGYSSKILLDGGKMVLISNVIYNKPVYILSVYTTSIKIIRELESAFSTFLWGRFNGNIKKEMEILEVNGQTTR